VVVYPKISGTVQKFLNFLFGFIYFINYYIFTSWCFHSDILNIFVKISIFVERYPIILLSNGLFLLCLFWLLWVFFIQNYNILPQTPLNSTKAFPLLKYASSCSIHASKTNAIAFCSALRYGDFWGVMINNKQSLSIEVF
jgi:hypothetical protein